MSVVATPEVRSPVLSTIDVESVVVSAANSVVVWRETDADAVVVDTTDTTTVEEIRETAGGDAVPLVLVTTDARPDASVDAVVAPDATAVVAQEAVVSAQNARDYRVAVDELYAACRDRTAGNPEAAVDDLRAKADRAYDELDGVPPSVFHVLPDGEQ